MKILVTGGAGYIGSHTVVELLKAGHDVVVIDNLSNSSSISIERIKLITGLSPIFIEGDVRDQNLVEQILCNHGVKAVIHFAGLKAVGDSVRDPLGYYDNNLVGTLRLAKAMAQTGVRLLVFSSSATVYSSAASSPLSETSPLVPTSPYGDTKLAAEIMLRDLVESGGFGQDNWRIALLRYFNPVGAHESGLIGEDPTGIPGNLMPYISQVAVGKLEYLNIFGNDYPTSDGTGVRDYIHVVDLSKGHLAALSTLASMTGSQVLTVNLGTGHGHSVLEMVDCFQKVIGRPIPYRIGPRRPGDIPLYFADVSHAARILGWVAELNLTRMCVDSWRWQSTNPCGYR